MSEKKNKWINPNLAPLFMWAFVAFFAMALPPFFRLDNPFMHGIMLWLILLLQVGFSLASAFSSYMEVVQEDD